MLCAPVVESDVVSVAVPELSVPVPSVVLVVESTNVTVPVAAEGATVAVSLKLVPEATLLTLLARLMVVLVIVLVVELELEPDVELCMELLQPVTRETARAKRTGSTRFFIMLSSSGAAGQVYLCNFRDPFPEKHVLRNALPGSAKPVAPACAPCRHSCSDTFWVAMIFLNRYRNFLFSRRVCVVG